MDNELEEASDWRSHPRKARTSRYNKSSVARLRSLYKMKQDDFARNCYLNASTYKAIERRQHRSNLNPDKRHACKISAITGASLDGLLNNKLTKDGSDQELTLGDIKEFEKKFKVLDKYDENSLKWLFERDQNDLKYVSKIKEDLIGVVANNLSLILQHLKTAKGKSFVAQLLFFSLAIDETVEQYKLTGEKIETEPFSVVNSILNTIRTAVPDIQNKEDKTVQMRECIERFASILFELEKDTKTATL